MHYLEFNTHKSLKLGNEKISLEFSRFGIHIWFLTGFEREFSFTVTNLTKQDTRTLLNLWLK